MFSIDSVPKRLSFVYNRYVQYMYMYSTYVALLYFTLAPRHLHMLFGDLLSGDPLATSYLATYYTPMT